ncbi:MAG: anthranilate synthase component I [Burkholderiaceae bacterium]|nr:anthranilate synthase component I [Burkholderiaceae bacterium]MDH5208983.1 anthranilate synthase component I [Burkholderiaceae bacterium]
MTELEFKALAVQGYTRIPLIAESFADLETPLSLYLKLANEPNTFLLESVVGGERFGRYSFIGLPARTAIRSFIRDDGPVTEVVQNGKVVETIEGDPLAAVERFEARFRVAQRPGLPRFAGGLAGYFGYDAVRVIEKKLARPKHDDLGVPDILLLLAEEVAVIDNLAGRIYLIVHADPRTPEAYARARQRLRELKARLARPIEPPHSRASVRREEYREFPKEQYLAAVARAKEYIAAGDVMQVQIGQRIRKPYADSPLSLYRALRTLNPSPYMYFYNFGDFHLVGASPEILVRSEDRQGKRMVAIRPIAGTRPRGATPEQDAILAAELAADPKERAEHLMLIDLARNDIGRIARTGTVKVTEQYVVEKYSHVQHLVSHVEGELEPGMTNLDVLRATFPAGTLSGAPKVRAMEIIDELEPVKRGVYGGAAGYLSFAGDMDLAIVIRTAIIKDNVLYAQAAAGIVADSVAESEWKETEVKARAVLRAAEQVEDGFDAE